MIKSCNDAFDVFLALRCERERMVDTSCDCALVKLYIQVCMRIACLIFLHINTYKCTKTLSSCLSFETIIAHTHVDSGRENRVISFTLAAALPCAPLCFLLEALCGGGRGGVSRLPTPTTSTTISTSRRYVCLSPRQMPTRGFWWWRGGDLLGLSCIARRGATKVSERAKHRGYALCTRGCKDKLFFSFPSGGRFLSTARPQAYVPATLWRTLHSRSKFARWSIHLILKLNPSLWSCTHWQRMFMDRKSNNYLFASLSKCLQARKKLIMDLWQVKNDVGKWVTSHQ